MTLRNDERSGSAVVGGNLVTQVDLSSHRKVIGSVDASIEKMVDVVWLNLSRVRI